MKTPNSQSEPKSKCCGVESMPFLRYDSTVIKVCSICKEPFIPASNATSLSKENSSASEKEKYPLYVKEFNGEIKLASETPDWMEEFDEKFVWNMTTDDHDVVAHYNEEDRELEFWNAYKIKSFIASKIEEARKEGECPENVWQREKEDDDLMKESREQGRLEERERIVKLATGMIDDYVNGILSSREKKMKPYDESLHELLANLKSDE